MATREYKAHFKAYNFVRSYVILSSYLAISMITMSYTVNKFRLFQHTQSSKWSVQRKRKFSNALQSDTNSAEVIFKIILILEPLGTIHDEICNWST